MEKDESWSFRAFPQMIKIFGKVCPPFEGYLRCKHMWNMWEESWEIIAEIYFEEEKEIKWLILNIIQLFH